MDESQGNSGSLPPFLTKTYEMVDDRSTDNIVSWSATGRSFIVWNQLDFSRDLLPRYFKHNNFSSFIRQLNTYGFRKVDPEQWEFANDDFVRGQPHLLKNIHRRKPVHSHSLQNLQAQGNAAPLTESERQSLKDNIERLTKERESLCLELQRHEQEREEYESKMKLCKDHLQHLQCRQKNLESLVSRVLQRPGLSLNLVPQLEIHDRKRRLRIGYLYEEAAAGDNLVGKTQASTRENGDESSVPSSKIELIEQLESSLAFWESMVHDMSQCAEEDLALEYEPTHHAESPARSGIQLNVDIQPKSSGIDMNSEPPAAPTPKLALASSTEQAVGTTASAPTGVNDVFWEQFLTENPGSSETQEVQSERKDSDGRKSDSRPGDHHNLWCNLGNNLAGPMGHLTQAERT